jgi:acyl-CoA synthetase (AMP-forming)/AMP-acid ligase II
MNMGLHLTRSALWFRDRTAVIYEDTRLTYQEFNQRVNRLTNALLSLGVKKGDRVALLSPNCHQLLEGAYACYKGGFVEVPLNARLSIPELTHMLNNSESGALILGKEFIEGIQDARSDIGTVRHYITLSRTPPSMIDYESLLQDAPFSEPFVDMEVGLDDIASLNYTSGTSGTLKAAMLSHRNRICHAKKQLLVPGIDIDEKSVMCHVGPVTHASAGMILPMIWRGGCNLILGGFDIERLLNTIEKERVTHLLLVPTMINFIMAYPNLKRYDLSSIRTINYGASPMAVERIKEAIDIFGPVLIQVYGLTETSAQVTYLSKEDHLINDDPIKLKRLASAGIPCLECEVRVVNEKGEDVGPGEVGEIIERGDDTMLGYWKDPELTARTLRNGWVHTKDMAKMDEDGYIYIVDRKGDMIISGGFNIYPSEVENALYEHPAVFEASVIGVPDEVWGESVKAIIVLRKGMSATADELIGHCKKRLASYKKPKSVDFIEELPKNPYGKILRRKLREKYWTGHERMVS